MKLITTLAFCHKDRDATMELVALLADLEPKQNLELDLVLVKDYDTEAIPADFIKKYAGKFRTLSQTSCTTQVKGYWPGANALFHFTANYVNTLVLKNPAFKGISAWLNLESDCVPLQKDWHAELSKRYHEVCKKNKAILGNIIPPQPNYGTHVNGVALYPTDLATRFGNRLVGCSPIVPFDVHYGPKFVPIALDDGAFYIKWKMFTIGKKELFSPPEGKPLPVWYHGVKDASARIAVREKLIEGIEKETKVEVIPNNPGVVFTFFEQLSDKDVGEEKYQLDLWKRVWEAQGFKTRVLNKAVAAQHPKYKEVVEKLHTLPTVNSKVFEDNCFLRWLALGVVGGGLMSDYDVFNSGFKAEDAKPVDLMHVYYKDALCPCVAFMSSKGVDGFIDYLLKSGDEQHTLEGGKPHVSDQTVICTMQHEKKVGTFSDTTDEISLTTGKPLIHVSTTSVRKKYGEYTRKSSVLNGLELKLKNKK